MDSLQEKQSQLEGLYNECFKKIANYAFARIGDTTEAEDIASDVFIKALDALKTYQDRGIPMRSWLFKIAHNLVVDHLARKGKQKVVPLDTATDIPEEDDPVNTAETNLEMERVNRAMSNLTEEQREVVNLRFFSGLSSKEVASLMNKKDGAVRQMQFEALAKLRNALNQGNSK